MKNNYLPRYQKILLFCVLLLGGHFTFAQSLPNPTNVTPNQVYCTSVSVTLQATCSEGEPVWYDENNDEIYDLDVTISSPTIYTVVCADPCSCNTSNPVFLTFDPLEPLVATRDQVACTGDQVKLIASCALGVVEWFKNDTSTPVAPEDLIQTITAPVTYLVRCNDASESCITDTKTVSITLGATRLDPPTAYNSDETVCRGTPVPLSATCPTGFGHFFEEDGLTEINASAIFAEVTSTYKVRCEDGFACPSPFESFTITVTVPPLPTGVTNPTVCMGQLVTLTANCSAGENVVWYLNNEITQVAITTFTASANATYKVRCETIADPTCVSDFASSVLTVTTNITSQPVSMQACLGDIATFTVTVNSTSTFQWQKRQGNGSYINIPSATSATLAIPNTVLANKGFYRCAVTSTTCTIYTNEVMLTFKDALVDNGKIIPGGASFLDEYGSSVAISDSLGLVGAWSKNGGMGAAYILKLNPNGKWTTVQELAPSDLGSNDFFSSAMAISGDTLFVSAPNHNSRRGAVYIFAKQAFNTWTQIDKLTRPGIDPSSYFGGSLSVDNGTMVIGADGFGSVFIYERNATTGVWELAQDITKDPSTEFGYDVGISGNAMVIGAPGQGTRGAIFVYEKSGPGSWIAKGSYSPAASSGIYLFGSSVAISGNNILASSIDPTAVTSVSSVIPFQRNAEGNWLSKPHLDFPELATDGTGGFVVSIYDNMAIVGAPLNQINKGAAIVFELNNQGNWIKKRLLIPADIKSGDNYGASVAIGKNGAIVGAPYLPIPISGSLDLRPGSSYFYRLHTYAKPVVSTIAQAASTCPAATATFNLTGLPSTDAYTITYKIDVAGTEKTVVVTPDSTGKASFTETLIFANNTKSIFITKIKNNVSTCEQTSSVSSVLAVKAPTQIIENPGPMTVCFGETAYFMSEATGEGLLTFQWQRQAPATNGFDQPLNNNFSDVSMLTLPDRTLADNGAKYRVRVFGECGMATSNDATLTVLPKASVTATTSGPICPGSTAQITFTGTPNAQIFYKVNNVPASVTLNAMGTATVNTEVLTHDVDYHLTSMHVLGNCSQQLSDIVRVQVRTLGSNPPLLLTSPLHDVLPNGTQSYAAETIQTANKINTSATASHIANKFVILEPGFEAKSGSVYTARVTSACP